MVSAYMRYVHDQVSTGNNWAIAPQTRCVDAALVWHMWAMFWFQNVLLSWLAVPFEQNITLCLGHMKSVKEAVLPAKCFKEGIRRV